MAGSRSPRLSAGTRGNTKPSPMKKANPSGLALCYWWRRRESNPRPRTLRPRLYMLSLSIVFNHRAARQTGHT